ncbi:hypothetical protein C1646_750786 [Rhizophagus diaphanus]|nr:hypothetical protein C1646_750786 [Rhizophagus diaphanus] [Rhizophagus sp. MUCL 43196]
MAPGCFPGRRAGGRVRWESDYETALTCQNTQNTETRWYTAIRRFLFWRRQGKDIEFYDGSTQWIGSENDFCDLSKDWFLIKANLKETLQEAHNRYNEEANAIFWKSGDITWAEPYEGIVTELDFNEFYPNLLASGMTGWPIGPGEFRTFSHISMDPISYNMEYRIYRAFIRGQPADQNVQEDFAIILQDITLRRENH